MWIGLPYGADEVPERAEAIRDALEKAGTQVVDAKPHSDDALLAVHDPDLVAVPRDAWALWVAAGYPDVPGQDNVVGYIFPHPGSSVRTSHCSQRPRPQESGTSPSTR